jgi:hypothetical protein
MTRGLLPLLAEGSARATDTDTTDEILAAAIEHAKRMRYCAKGDSIVALHRIGGWLAPGGGGGGTVAGRAPPAVNRVVSCSGQALPCPAAPGSPAPPPGPCCAGNASVIKIVDIK